MATTARAIAREAHKRCGADPGHSADQHIPLAGEYAAALQQQRITAPARAVVEAIVEIGGDPEKGEWRAHPPPPKVIQRLRDKGVVKRG